MQALVNFARKTVSGARNTVMFRGQVLDISVVSRCLAGMSYPCEGVSTLWRNDVFAVRDFLTYMYGSRWRVFNLTESQYDPQLLYGAVTHCPIPDHHAPPLMRALDYVQAILAHLAAGEGNVAVVHCLAGKGRTGTVIAMVLVAQGYSAGDALAIFATARGQPVSQPSQMRYVGYFERLLLREDRRAEAPEMVVRRIELSHGPNCDFEGEKAAWPKMVVELGEGRELARLVAPQRVFFENLVAFDNLQLRLRGDVTLRMFHLDLPMFRVQWHTGFVRPGPGGVIEFALNELDEQNEQPNAFSRRFNPATKLRFFLQEENTNDNEKLG